MRRVFAVSLLFVVLATPGKLAVAQSERIPADSELAPVAAQGCGSESSLKSTRYDMPTSLRFRV